MLKFVFSIKNRILTIIYKKEKKLIYSFFVYILFFLFFFFRNHYYLPAKLIIEGFSSGEGKMLFQWDTGDGFNKFELEELNFGKSVGKKEHLLEIIRTGEKNILSKGAEVWITEIKIDDINIPLNEFVKFQDVTLKNNNLTILKDNVLIKRKLIFSKISLKLINHSWSGKVKIGIDGNYKIFDLYSEKSLIQDVVFKSPGIPSNFSIMTDIPQLKLKGIQLSLPEKLNDFRISKIEVQSNNGKVQLPINNAVSGIYSYPSVNLKNQKFNTLLFSIHLLLSGICTYLIFIIYPFVKTIARLRSVFLKDKRPYFWGMFIISMFVYSLWLVGQWPGAMTNDSLDSWLQGTLLKFNDWHPYLYTIFILMLRQFYQSPAIVGIFQIIATALVGSYIFYYCLKNKVSILIIIPFFLIFIFSIPIGIYNITIWKDIPFSLAIVIISFYIYKRYLEKKHHSKPNYLFLTLIFIPLLQFRHNGVIYYLLIPILFLFIFDKKDMFKLATLLFSIFFVSKLILPALLDIKLNNSNPNGKVPYQLNPIVAIIQNKSYVTDSKEKDIEIVSKFLDWKTIQEFYNPCYVDPIYFHNNFKREGVALSDIRNFDRLYKRLIFDNPNLFLTERINNFFCHVNGGVLETYGNNILSRSLLNNKNLYGIIYSPKSKYINRITTRMMDLSVLSKGIFSHRNMIWSIPFPIFILSLFLVGFGIKSRVCLYVIPSLSMSAILFFLIPGVGFRYFYYIYLSSMFIIPLVFIDNKNKRTKFEN